VPALEAEAGERFDERDCGSVVVEATLLTLAVRRSGNGSIGNGSKKPQTRASGDGGGGGGGTAAESSVSYYPRPRRPALVVSSTSWTPDEDFGVLLEAAGIYDRLVRTGTRPDLPDLLVVVNKVPDGIDAEMIREQVEGAYQSEVVALLPLNAEMSRLGSGGLFVNRFPDHPFTRGLQGIVRRLLSGRPGS
jgi:hypothetical protein